MHDGEPAAAEASNSSGWRDILDRRHAELIEDLGKAIESALDSARSEAATRAAESERAGSAARRATENREAAQLETEALQQALRRLRQPTENREILKILNEITAPWAERSVVVVFQNHQAVTVAIRGGEDAAPIVIELAEAPAIAAAIESRDLVMALAAPSEISSGLAAMFHSTDSVADRACLFPILVRQSVRAILIAAGAAIAAAPLEVLCEAAGMKLETAELTTNVRENITSAVASGLVSIAPVSPPIAQLAAESPRTAWDDLSADDQRLHLQAQRMARVRVATLRLNHGDALRRGEAAQDIYGALGTRIDPARREFLQMFIAKSATMVDYLHLEILANLAHNDEKVLGSGYPGPMV